MINSIPHWLRSSKRSVALTFIICLILYFQFSTTTLVLAGTVLLMLNYVFWLVFVLDDSKELDVLRDSLDRVDKKIVDLLHKRRNVVKVIASIKEGKHLPVVDHKREKSHIEDLEAYIQSRYNKGGFSRPVKEVKNIFRAIIDQSTEYQHERRDRSNNESQQRV